MQIHQNQVMKQLFCRFMRVYLIFNFVTMLGISRMPFLSNLYKLQDKTLNEEWLRDQVAFLIIAVRQACVHKNELYIRV